MGDGLRVVSLFDGISCGLVALKRAGIPVKSYAAFEIDKNAIKVSKHNHPEIEHYGNVIDSEFEMFEGADLLMGGSPCQGFSSVGKRLNFDDPRSALFFEFVRALREIKPKYFLLENVIMPQWCQDVISEQLGVQPIKIDSALVSAQMRKRLYWTNIPGVIQPEDKNILLRDVLEDPTLNKGTVLGRRLNERGVRDDYNKDVPITQCLEVRNTNRDKSNCLTTVDKDNVLTTMPIGRHPNAFVDKLPFRYYTVKECCRLQTLDDNYMSCIDSEYAARKMLGNGWTCDVIAHILNFIPRKEK